MPKEEKLLHDFEPGTRNSKKCPTQSNPVKARQSKIHLKTDY
jgi:hypothetical protein